MLQNHLDIVKYLAEKEVHIESGDRWGRTALHSAAWKNNFPLLKFLLEIGAPIEATDEVSILLHSFDIECPKKLNLFTD